MSRVLLALVLALAAPTLAGAQSLESEDALRRATIDLYRHCTLPARPTIAVAGFRRDDQALEQPDKDDVHAAVLGVVVRAFPNSVAVATGALAIVRQIIEETRPGQRFDFARAGAPDLVVSFERTERLPTTPPRARFAVVFRDAGGNQCGSGATVEARLRELPPAGVLAQVLAAEAREMARTLARTPGPIEIVLCEPRPVSGRVHACSVPIAQEMRQALTRINRDPAVDLGTGRTVTIRPGDAAACRAPFHANRLTINWTADPRPGVVRLALELTNRTGTVYQQNQHVAGLPCDAAEPPPPVAVVAPAPAPQPRPAPPVPRAPRVIGGIPQVPIDEPGPAPPAPLQDPATGITYTCAASVAPLSDSEWVRVANASVDARRTSAAIRALYVRSLCAGDAVPACVTQRRSANGEPGFVCGRARVADRTGGADALGVLPRDPFPNSGRPPGIPPRLPDPPSERPPGFAPPPPDPHDTGRSVLGTDLIPVDPENCRNAGAPLTVAERRTLIGTYASRRIGDVGIARLVFRARCHGQAVAFERDRADGSIYIPRFVGESRDPLRVNGSGVGPEITCRGDQDRRLSGAERERLAASTAAQRARDAGLRTLLRRALCTGEVSILAAD